MPKERAPLTRSEQMARIRGRDTKPEHILRRALWAAGLRYRLQVQTPGGRVDLVFPSSRVAILVDGCFWHGCPRHYVRPRTKESFWETKLAENVARDRRQTLDLEAQGWRVIRIWEHSVHEELQAIVHEIQQVLASELGQPPAEDWRVVRVVPLNDAGSHECRFLQSLRNPSEQRIEEGPRVTTKWRRAR
jgi:DNA mismatch endonuclease (patch repair protein)